MLIPDCEVQLDHAADFLRIASQSQKVLAASRSGEVTIFDPKLAPIRTHAFDTRLGAIAIHPLSEILAFVTEDGQRLFVADTNFEIVCEQPAGHHGMVEGSDSSCGFHDCHFGAAGELVVARRVRHDSVVLQNRVEPHWSVLQATEVRDPFGMSDVDLGGHSQNVVARLGREDGAIVYWAFPDNGTWRVTKPFVLQNTTLPVFHPNGHEFLTMEDTSFRKLCRVSFPDFGMLEWLDWPFDEIEGEPGFGEDSCYLSDTHALVMANEGRLFVTNLDFDKPPEEVVIEGHEPKPCEELYPLLGGDTQVIADAISFRVLSTKHVISAHQQLPNRNGPRKDVLVRFGHELFGEFTTRGSSGVDSTG